MSKTLQDYRPGSKRSSLNHQEHKPSREDTSEIDRRSQDQFNDLRDMELSNTTVQINDTGNPFLGVLDDCIQELEISQNRIVGRMKEFSSQRKSLKTQPNFEKSFNSHDYDPFLHRNLDSIGRIGGTGDGAGMKILEREDIMGDIEAFETGNEKVYRTPDGHSKNFLQEHSSNESFNLIPKMITSTKRMGKRQKSFYRDTNFKVIMEENKQLRMLMSDYLREIDQLRYAYTKLRTKYSKVKDKNESMGIEIKRITEINKLLKNGNSKKNQIFQNFCFCPNRPHAHKQKSFADLMKKRQNRKIRSQESLHNIKVKLKSSKRNSFSPKNQTMKTCDLTSGGRPLRSQIAKLIHRTAKPVKPRKTFDSLNFQDKLQWIKKRRNVGRSLNLKSSGDNEIDFKNFEFYNKHNYGFNKTKRRRNDVRSDNILSSFKKVKKLKQKFMKGKSRKFHQKFDEGIVNPNRDDIKIAIRNFENHTFGQEHFENG